MFCLRKTCALWYTYIELVSKLPLFTLIQRDGLSALHLSPFQMMLSYFHRYKHINYRIYFNKRPYSNKRPPI